MALPQDYFSKPWVLLLLLVAALAFLGYRLYRQRADRGGRAERPEDVRLETSGDSESLEAVFGPRPPSELVERWQRRFDPVRTTERGRRAREEMRRLLSEAGLRRQTDTLIMGARDSIRIRTRSVEDGALPVGSSKLGGIPDLPETVAWPEHGGRPMLFLGQIRLSDLSDVDETDALPDSGVLAFFYDAEEQPWGFDPEDRGAWRVIHSDDELLARREPPLDTAVAGRAAALSFEYALTLEPFLSSEVGQDERERYGVFWDAHVATSEEPNHRMLGLPAPIQDPYMGAAAQLASNGIYMGERVDYSDPAILELLDGAGAWRMLLQLDSDDIPGFMWGDAGRLYFWIRNDSLERHDFDDVWVILQCY